MAKIMHTLYFSTPDTFSASSHAFLGRTLRDWGLKTPRADVLSSFFHRLKGIGGVQFSVAQVAKNYLDVRIWKTVTFL